MKLGVMSDSHENMQMIANAVNFFNKQGVDIVIHAGDIVSPITVNEFKNLKSRLIAIYGNNDGEKDLLRERFSGLGHEIHPAPYEFTFAHRKILLFHEPHFLKELFRCDSYDIIIYGHTHLVDIQKDKALILNPGECGGWLYGKPTVALIETIDLSCQIINL